MCSPGSAVSVPGWRPLAASAVSASARSIHIPGGHMKPYTTQRRRCITRMQEKSNRQPCRISTLFAEASLVRAFQSLDAGMALPTQEEPCSLRLLGSLKPKDLAICSLKMFPACYRMTGAGRFRPSSTRWMSWGTMSRGRCLTARISASPKPGTGCTLSDFLGNSAPERYWLSPKQVHQLFPKSENTARGAESMIPPA